MDLKDVNLDHWWKVVSIAGALVSVAGAGASYAPAILIGIGLLGFGLVEWSTVHRIERPILGWNDQLIGTQFVLIRERTPVSISLQALSIAMLALGLGAIVYRAYQAA